MTKANQAAFDIGQMSERLAGTYMTYAAALTVASDPRAIALAPTINPGFVVPIGTVARKDGTEHAYNFAHFLSQASEQPGLVEEFTAVWLGGALLTLGDALSGHDYFDHAPELELVYHLRNGIGHGNQFNLTFSGGKRLQVHPAHNRLAWIRSDKKTDFEIDASLNGTPVLYDFMAAGDVLDLLSSVGLYLIRMGNGDPLRPEITTSIDRTQPS